MKRDQIVGIVAAIVAAVSAALPWIKNVTVLYETNGKSSLGAFDVPVTFLFSGPAKSPGGSIPAVAVAVAVVALGLIVWTFLPRTPRRVLYIVWGLLAMAAPVLLYMQLQKDLDAKGLTTGVFTHYGLGPFFLVGGGLIAIVAGIIGAGKESAAEAAPAAAGAYGTGSQAPDAYAHAGYGQDAYAGAGYAQAPYGGAPQAQPAAPYATGGQSWTPAPDPYAQAPQAPQQPAQEWGVPQPATQTWDQPAQVQPPQYPQTQVWDQPAQPDQPTSHQGDAGGPPPPQAP